MTTRLDNFSAVKKLPDLFSDFLTEFVSHPISGDVARVKNDQSIKQSLKNLILTNYGERMFQSNIGSNVHLSLFELNDITASEDLRYHILKTISTSEPRVSVVELEVQSSQDNTQLLVSLVFSINNTNSIQSLDLILKRLR